MFKSLKGWFVRRTSMRTAILAKLNAYPNIRALADADSCNRRKIATDCLIREEEKEAEFFVNAKSCTLAKYHRMVKNELLELNELRSEIRDIYQQIDKM